MSFLAVICGAFLLGSAAAIGVLHPKTKCPDVSVKADLNVANYAGVWYEVMRYPNPFQKDSTCSAANYQVLNATHVKVTNSGTLKNHSAIVVHAQAEIQDPAVPAKLIVKFSQSPFPAPYWVLDTDYNNFAVVYSCSLHPGNTTVTEYAWVLSRKPTLSGDTNLISIHGVFNRNGLTNDSVLAPGYQSGRKMRIQRQ